MRCAPGVVLDEEPSWQLPCHAGRRDDGNLPGSYTYLHHRVYSARVTRTNVEIDDTLVVKVMQRYGLSSKRAAIDLALRRLVGEPLSHQEALALEGSGWEGDLDEMRRSRADG